MEVIAGIVMETKIEDSRIKKKKDYFRIKNMRFVSEISPRLLMKISYKVIIIFFRYLK